MSRVRLWVLGATTFLLALQVFLLTSWAHSGTVSNEGVSAANHAYKLLQNADAEKLQMQNAHTALQSRIALQGAPTATGTLTHQQGTNSVPVNIAQHACIGSPVPLAEVVAAVVVVAYNRLDYLQRCITSLLETHGQNQANRQKFPLYISQDGNQSGIAELARNHAPAIFHLQHVEADNFLTRKKKEPVAYYRIASHYRFIMQQFFDCWQYPKLIVLEDDMKLAVDFFPYFQMGAKMLDNDSSLYCVSSWNDHGQAQFVQNSSRLERSDFFPGLGWMLTNSLWQELKSKWPAAYWDDWMRLRTVRKSRQCIRPEVCRTYNFGEKGSSHGQFYEKYLKPVKLNDVMVNWQNQDVHYLEPKAYAQMIGRKMASAKLLTSTDEVKLHTGTVKLLYDGKQEYEKLANELGIIDDWKDGVPRGSYHGIVMLHMHNVEVLLAPVPVIEKGLKHRRAGKPVKAAHD